MNIIPRINGNNVILSNKRLFLNGINIIDTYDFFDKSIIDLLNKNFNSENKVNIHFLPNKDLGYNYKINIINGEIFIQTTKDLAYNSLVTILNLKDELYHDMIISDTPKYKHREFSIDVARHYFSIDELKKLIDEAANLKINKIHLHLSDNQGWRIESKKYPILNDVGGKDGFYTVNELKDLVEYANNRYIDIIPEIDIPGHVGAILASFPELSCSGKKIELDEGYKTNDKTLCFGNTKSLVFVKDLLDEIMEIFPSKYIHIGCDELDLSYNKNCPKCIEYMKKNGFNNLNEVVIDFINKISEHIFSNKREVIVWNDATRYGKLDERIIVQNWFDYPFDKTNLNEFNNNRRFIFGSTFHTYFDYPLSLVTLENTYTFSPRINNKQLNGSNILGISSHVWTEVIDNEKNLEEKIFPRLIAFSENAWSKKLDYDDFLQRLEIYIKSLNERGLYTSKPSNNEIEEIANYFKTFLNNNDNSFSSQQILIGAKLVLKLLSESKHLKDTPAIAIKILKNHLTQL